MDQIPYFNDPLNNAGNKAAPTSLNIFNTDLQMAKKHLAKLSLDYGIDAKTVIYKGSTGKKNEIRDISLETVEITPPHFSEEKSDYILNFCGNAQNINDSFEELADMANDTNSRVVSFNYRTVGRDNQNRNGISRVASFQELVEDGIAQVQALLNRKIPPYKIKLYGHSLGGAVAAAVAAHFHSQTPSIKIYLVNGRSFTNVENVIKQNFKKYDNDAKSSKKDNADEIASPLLGKNFANETIAQSPKESILQRIKNWFGNRCAKLATDNGWKIDTAEYCKNIDPNYIRTFEVKGDQIMPKHTETLGPKDSHTIFDVYVPPNLSAHELRTYCHNVNVRELYLPQGAGKRTYFYSWLSDVFKTWNDRDAVQNTHNVDAGIIHNEPEFRLTKAPENKPESPKVLQQAEVNEPLSPKMQPNYSSQEIGFFGSPKSPAQRLSLNHVNKGSQGSDNSDNSDNSNKHSLDSRHTNGLQKSELSSQKGLEQENMKNSSCSPF
ncbi:MAG: alpha/beta hydrolase [Legionella sp.]|nr:alpha/beta hydrolase [Legionella sp.]